MNEQKTVSVIIPTYNRACVLKEAIDSVLAQTYRDFELIVVDDGSTDDTSEMLSAFADNISTITTFHRGPSAARNAGINASRGEWIAFLDSDDLWLKDKLKKQLDFFTQNPEYYISQTEEIWIRNGVRVNPRNKHKKYSGWIFEHCLPLCIVSPSAVMIHRSIFDKIGLFDETMPACEDYDLWLRIAVHYPIHLIDEPLITKRGGHADQQSRKIKHLDRYRIQALCKIMQNAELSTSQYSKAYKVLKKKCTIYANGCLKRGKNQEARKYSQLPDQYKNPKAG